MRYASFAVVVALVACGQSNLASGVAKSPTVAAIESKCTAEAPDPAPSVVTMAAADKTVLEARAKSGIVVVRYESCKLQVLPRCQARGAYKYTGTTAKKERVVARNGDELHAKLPLGAAALAAKMESKGALAVDTVVSGRMESELKTVAASDVEGDCAGATHWVTALSVGAFRMAAGSEAELSANVSVGGAGAGGSSQSSQETLSEDGDRAACEKSGADDPKPPSGCGAVLRIEVSPLGKNP